VGGGGGVANYPGHGEGTIHVAAFPPVSVTVVAPPVATTITLLNCELNPQTCAVLQDAVTPAPAVIPPLSGCIWGGYK
jgi:hypothetical protein